jgi:peptidoglycan/LPS O-acetylase OafA/YrhL
MHHASVHPFVARPAEAPARPSHAPVAPPPPAADPRAAASGLRPEIQALRAIAVLLVLIYHLWPASIPGGFVGVDVFFAISGFLITSHLLREVDRTGRVSLTAFWARRARRLLPAALLVLAFCAIATLLVVPHHRWEQYFGDIRASTVYAQNWHLADVAVDYFAAENLPSPVRHYWSLSAEEQFYLVWPALILLAVLAAPRMRRRSIGIVLSALTLLSLAYSIRDTATHTAAAYFVTPTRAWEFGAGGLLALAPAVGGGAAALRSLLSWLGLAAIVVAAFAYTAGVTPFPGSAALLPVLGAVAVMGAGAPESRWAPTPALRLAPVRFVGDVSYSIYLWHWPLIILAPFVVGEVHTETRIAILMLTILAAWLTKLFVEDPVRAGRFLTRRHARWTFAFAAAGMAIVLALSAHGMRLLDATVAEAEAETTAFITKQPRCFGAASRDPGKRCVNPALRLRVVPKPLEAKRRSAPNTPCKRTRLRIHGKRVCTFGVAPERATSTAALIGDSHAGHWRPAVDAVARQNRWHVLSIGHSGCPFSKATKLLPEPDRSHCVKWKAEVFKWFERHPEVKTVFVSQFAGGTGVASRRGQSGHAAAIAGYAAAWDALPASVEQIVVIRDTPKVRGNTDTCVQRAIDGRRPAGRTCAIARQAALVRDPAIDAAARTRSARVRAVDMTRFFCDSRSCFPVIGGVLVFKDTTHLTGLYAQTLGPYLARRVRQPRAARVRTACARGR